MNNNRTSRISFLTLVAVVITLTTAASASVTETVIHSFPQTSTDAATIKSGVIMDSVGNLYGTGQQGGTAGFGAVYELSPVAGGGWTEQVIYSFSSIADGVQPNSSLTLDSSGNFFGITFQGGTGSCPSGCGTVYELSPSSTGWTKTTVYSFSGGADGKQPSGGMLLDSAGNLYGVTSAGGAHTFGAVYKISPTSTGWHESVLYSFSGSVSQIPCSALTMDSAGRLYGATFRGGANGRGSIFQLSPPSLHSWWTYQLIHSFNGADGETANFDPLIIDAAGNLYGTTPIGGNNSSFNGVVFELSPTAGGHYAETVLHSFGTGVNGGLPEGGLAFDASGNLWGTTTSYGATSGNAYGTVFELTPITGGHWSFATAYNFTDLDNGGVPLARLIFGASGNAYGTTEYGGTTTSQEGTVFELSSLPASK